VTIPRSTRSRPGLRRLGRYLLLSVLAFIVIFPLYITVVNSLLPAPQIAAQPPKFFPSSPVWSTYNKAWTSGHFGHYLFNSAVVTTIIVVGQVLTAILAGYAFAFLRFPFKRTLFVVFLATLMIPFEVTIVQNLTTVVDLGLYDTYAGLALPFLATGFGAFLLRQAFLGIPRDLEDAAALDGYGHWRFLWRVAVPLVRPAIGALGVFAFLTAWNQYLWPLLVTNTPTMTTIVIGIRQMIGNGDAQTAWHLVMATALLALLPPIAVVLAMQRWFVQGLIEPEK